MKFCILASLILFGLLIFRSSKKQRKQRALEEQSFWEKENQANNVRRKSLDDLNYIKIPWENLPTHVMEDHMEVSRCMDTIRELSKSPIVNLTGFTNTDLKLKYGTANITLLTEYDQNYTLFARALQEWAKLLHQGGFAREAQDILEYAVSTNTDISHTYYLLAEIYATNLEFGKIEKLLTVIDSLPIITKKTIVRTLQEAYL